MFWEGGRIPRAPKGRRARRTATPSTPPSLTMRFEPTPRTVTGTWAGKLARKVARSSSSAGRNSASAGPPTRNQVNGARGWSKSSLPRAGGKALRQLIRQGFQLRRQGVGPGGDVAGAQKHHQISRPSLGRNDGRQVRGTGQRQRTRSPVTFHAFHQGVPIHPPDAGVAGRVASRHHPEFRDDQ